MGIFGTPLQYIIVDRLGAFIYWIRFIWQQAPFDNTTPIYLINLHWKLALVLGLDLKLYYFSIFTELTKTSTLSSANFTEGNILLKERTQTMNNKIKLHILGVTMNKLGNWLSVSRCESC